MEHKKKKINKYDFIIYSSLMVAIIFIIIAIKSYYDNLDENETFFSSFKSAVQEMNEDPNTTPEEKKEEEPEDMKPVDKKEIINKELSLILEEKSLTDYLTKEMLESWGEYEIINIKFIRTITENYYCYQVDIKVPSKKAIFPTNSNRKKSTEEYQVLSTYFNISSSNNTYKVKSIDTPNR